MLLFKVINIFIFMLLSFRVSGKVLVFPHISECAVTISSQVLVILIQSGWELLHL